MARPLRIEYVGAVYHITSRGNAQQDIFDDDEDRDGFFTYLLQSCERYGWLCHAYCLMSNHYHLLIETREPTLSKGMRNLNGVYTQFYNRRHNRVGHLYQGRYKAILIEKDAHLLELARYIVLNPVRAQMVRSAKDWPWSSYRATAGLVESPNYLTTDWVLAGFGTKKSEAQMSYRKFVAKGKNQPSPWQHLKNQIYLGSDEFVSDMQEKINPEQSLDDIPKPQKRASAKALEWFDQVDTNRKRAMAKAYLSGHYTLKEVGQYFGVSYATVSRAVKDMESI